MMVGKIGLAATALSAVFLLVTVTHAALMPGDHLNRSLLHDGNTRLYDLHIPPSYDGSVPVPLVLDFHGLTSNKTQHASISGFKAVSDQEGFIVVYPLGLFGQPGAPENPVLPGASSIAGGPAWNAGVCCGEALVGQPDDIGFVRALVASVSAEINIDSRRVYATGLSNGGAMSHVLACEAADLFAAVAPLAFPMLFTPLSDCQPSRPVPILHFAGLSDTLVPYASGPLSFLGVALEPLIQLPSAADSFLQWRDLNGCVGVMPDTTTAFGASLCETYSNCGAGVHTALCSIETSCCSPFSGHILYINSDLNLARTAWDFLSQFVLPPPPVPCALAPLIGCRSGGKSSFQIKRSSNVLKNQLKWKLGKGDAFTQADLGDPVTTTSYKLCVYDDVASVPVLVATLTVDPNYPNSKWQNKAPRGFNYKDKAAGQDGVTKIQLKANDASGKTKVQLKAKGSTPNWPVPFSGTVFFAQDTTVTVQLINSETSSCWTSEFQTNKKNTGSRFKAKVP